MHKKYRKRVLLVSSIPIPHAGGLSTHFELLRAQLASRGQLAGVLTGSSAFVTAWERARVLLKHPIDQELRRACLLRAILKRSVAVICQALSTVRPQVLHAHDARATCAAKRALLALGTLVPIIQSVHGPWSKEAVSAGASAAGAYVKAILQLERFAFEPPTFLLPVDRGQEAILREEFGVPDTRLRTIPNAVNCAEIREMARRPLQDPNLCGVSYFVVPRRLVPKTGVGVAIEALSLMRTTEVKMLIAGDGPLRGELEAHALSLGVKSRVAFLGTVSRSELLPLMANSCGVVIPSIPHCGVIEATSLSALEALSCAVPVVASNIGGLAEIARTNSGVFSVPAGCSSKLADCMTALALMPPETRAEIGRRASVEVRSAFDVTQWCERIEQVYNEVSEDAVLWPADVSA